MFEQSFVEREGSGFKPWTILVSLAGQSLLLGCALLVPLIYTYEIPLHNLASAVLLAPPPPPPAPAPPEVEQKPAKAATPPPPSRFQAVLQAPREIPQETSVIDEGLAAPGPSLSGIAGGIPGGVPGGVLDLSHANMLTVPPPAPIRVGGNVQAARLESRVMPVYPEEAGEQDIGGTVLLEAIVTKDGSIGQLKVLEGHPLLVDAAVEAVRQWRYRPTRLNGVAVEVLTNISVIFKPSPPEEKEKGKRRNRRRR